MKGRDNDDKKKSEGVELNEVDKQGKSIKGKEKGKTAQKSKSSLFGAPASDMPEEFDYPSPEQMAENKVRREMGDIKEKLKPQTKEGTVQKNPQTNKQNVIVKKMTGVSQKDDEPKQEPANRAPKK